MTLNIIKYKLNKLLDTLHTQTQSVHCYLFGSILHKDNPSDIDILFIYQSEKDIEYIRASLIEIELQYPIHLLFLTVQEEVRFNFLRTQHHLKIFTTDSYYQSN
jgi:predicted nucleotidyltransferase